MRVAIAFSVALASYTADATLDIYCLDVGQGDCTFIVSSSGLNLLIDGGDNGMGISAVVPFLQSLGVTSLSYMVATHYDADHIGGLDEIASTPGLLPTVAYDRGSIHGTETFNDYVMAVGDRRQTIDPGQVIDLGDGISATCMCVNGVLEDQTILPVDAENERSIGLLVEDVGFSFWISGDLTGGGLMSADMESAVAPLVGDVDILRVNHHGSETSSNAYFLSTLVPEIGIISVGENLFGHPTQAVLERIGSVSSIQAIVQTGAGNGGITPLAQTANDHIHIHVNGAAYTVSGGTVSIEVGANSSLVGDLDNDFEVGSRDLIRLLRGWRNSEVTADLDQDMVLSSSDSFLFAVNWKRIEARNNTPTPSVTTLAEVTRTPTLTQVVLPSDTPTPTATFTPTASATSSPTPTVSRTSSPSPSRTHTVAPTRTNTLAPTRTNTPVPTFTVTRTRTRTATPTQARPRIELYSAIPNPVGTDAGNEVIKVINRGASTVGLESWKIRDAANNNVPLSGNITAGQIRSFNPSGAILNNEGDTLRLLDPSDVQVDSGTYGSVTEGQEVFF